MMFWLSRQSVANTVDALPVAPRTIPPNTTVLPSKRFWGVMDVPSAEKLCAVRMMAMGNCVLVVLASWLTFTSWMVKPAMDDGWMNNKSDATLTEVPDN